MYKEITAFTFYKFWSKVWFYWQNLITGIFKRSLTSSTMSKTAHCFPKVYLNVIIPSTGKSASLFRILRSKFSLNISVYPFILHTLPFQNSRVNHPPALGQEHKYRSSSLHKFYYISPLYKHLYHLPLFLNFMYSLPLEPDMKFLAHKNT
jgi:hypothetical protein